MARCTVLSPGCDPISPRLPALPFPPPSAGTLPTGSWGTALPLPPPSLRCFFPRGGTLAQGPRLHLSAWEGSQRPCLQLRPRSLCFSLSGACPTPGSQGSSPRCLPGVGSSRTSESHAPCPGALLSAPMCQAGLETSTALQRRGTQPETAWRGVLRARGGAGAGVMASCRSWLGLARAMTEAGTVTVGACDTLPSSTGESLLWVWPPPAA